MAPSAARPLAPAEAEALLGPYLLPSEANPAGVILAVSGGPDSVALMHLAAGLRARTPVRPILVATVDHGLRPDSRAEAEQVAAWAEGAGLAHRILTWRGPKPRTRVQETARDARYDLLAALAHEIGCFHVLTAHTLDDQAETVLMRLSRGSGVGGLAGMRPEVARGGITLARPFLSLRKARLLAACQAEGWPFFEDPANADPRFARARLRRLMPHLAREGLTPERLGILAARARRAEDALQASIAAALEDARIAATENRVELDGTALRGKPEAILLGVLARAIVEAAEAPTRPIRLERVEARILGDLRAALDRGGRCRMTLGGAQIDLRPDGRLTLTPEPPRRSTKIPF